MHILTESADHVILLKKLKNLNILHKGTDITTSSTIISTKPIAKSNSDFCTRTDISSFIRKTNAEPNIVPGNEISNPFINVVVITRCKILLFLGICNIKADKCERRVETLTYIAKYNTDTKKGPAQSDRSLYLLCQSDIYSSIAACAAANGC